MKKHALMFFILLITMVSFYTQAMALQNFVPQMPAPKQQPDLMDSIMKGMAAAHAYSQLQEDQQKQELAPTIQHLYENQARLSDTENAIMQQEVDFNPKFLEQKLKEMNMSTRKLAQEIKKKNIENQEKQIALDLLKKKLAYEELANIELLPDDKKQEGLDRARKEISKYAPELLAKIPDKYLEKDGKPNPFLQQQIREGLLYSSKEKYQSNLETEQAKDSL